MRYAGIIKNDVVNCPGIGVSIFLQGCDLRCQGCHNAALWDFNGGKEFNFDVLQEVQSALCANGIKRSLCILGGEPMSTNNLFTTVFIVDHIKNTLPDIKIYLWSGYTLEELEARNDNQTNYILENIDVLIDGPFIQKERDISLFMRGSKNQRIIDMHTKQEIDNLENL